MPSPSFHTTTIADYIRILVQRFWIIMLCTLTALMISSWFAVYHIQKQYRASVQISVWQKHKNNPYLRRLLPEGDLEVVISNIRDRIQGQSRLRMVALNLRYYIKNKYVQETYASKVPTEAELRKHYELQLSSGPAKEALLLTVSRMELISLGKILGDLAVNEADPFTLANYGLFNTSDYLLDEQTDRTLQQLARALTARAAKQIRESEPADADPSAVELKIGEELKRRRLDGTPGLNAVRAEAIRQVTALLRQPDVIQTISWMGWLEIFKEERAAPRLKLLGLYQICGGENTTQAFIDQRLDVWAARLKAGINISRVTGNFMHIAFDSVYANKDEAIPHLIVEVVDNMIRAEYYATEVGHIDDAKRQLGGEINTLQSGLLELNKDLAKFDQLVELQRAFAVPQGMERREKGELITLTPEDFDVPLVSIHIKRLNDLESEKRMIESEVEQHEKSISQLALRLKDPNNQEYVSDTIFRKVETPMVMNLREKRITLEEEFRKLSLTATDEHPLMKKLRHEMAQLDRAIIGADKPIEETITTKNPKINMWREQITLHEDQIVSAKVRLKHLNSQMSLEMKKAIEAPKNLQEFERKKNKRSSFKTLLDSKERELEKVLADERAGENTMSTVFQVHTPATKPLEHYAPRIGVIIAIGISIGLLVSLATIFFVEYADHSIKGVDDVKRTFDIPVLGTIPEFEFQEQEAQHIRWSLRLRRFIGIAPAINEEEMSLSQLKIVSKKVSNIRLLIKLLILCGMLALGSYMVMNGEESLAQIKTKISAAKQWVEEKFESVTTGENSVLDLLKSKGE